jgi:glutamyl-Q tRNA(Asp) synthetase
MMDCRVKPGNDWFKRSMPPVFRFAPSPNGYLHLGHAFSALLNFDLARRCGGRLLLRIEDIDQSRCRREYEDAIYEDLAWLGIAWEQPRRDRTAGGTARGRWRLAARP